MKPEEAKQAYDELIAKARTMNLQKTKEVYTEVHHVLPRSLGGDDSPENKMRMLGRKHFEAHWLLTFMWQKQSQEHHKMVKALHKMSFGLHKDEYHIMADEYEHVRTLNAEVGRETKGRHKRTPEVCKKIGDSKRGKKWSANQRLNRQLSDARDDVKKRRSDSHRKTYQKLRQIGFRLATLLNITNRNVTADRGV